MIRRMPIAAVLLLVMVSCVPGGYRYGGQAREKVVRTAQKYIGVRYKHGGATPGGFDCSGYVMYVYERNGILLPRSVKRQYQAGKKIRLGQAKPGDLVFFRTSRKRRLSHVGIYLGDRRFIHSPRTGKKVSYADMSKPYWRKRYIGSVTFLGKRVGPGISRASGG